LAGIVSDYRADVPAQELPTSLLSELKDQIGCDSVLFEGFRQRNWFAQSLPAYDYAGVEGLVLGARGRDRGQDGEPNRGPVCWPVVNRAPARPWSRPRTPVVIAMDAVGRARPMPREVSSSPGRMAAA
jgi:hypothetical protein